VRGCDAVGACTARARSDAPTLSLQEAAVRAAAVRERAPAPGEMLGLSGAEGRRAGGLALLFGAERDGLTNPEAPPPPPRAAPRYSGKGRAG
jgi:tRNA C32,U32 (ribose-2'-O)-methylase TrmJ